MIKKEHLWPSHQLLNPPSTSTIESSKESEELVDEEEEPMESKFEKMAEDDDIHTTYLKLYKNFEKHEKLYRLATRKLSEVELE